MAERGGDSQLARDHSLLLEERLDGFFRSGGSHGPTSFAGLGLGLQPTKVNEYASLAGPDDDEGSRRQPLARYVSSLSRVLPSGVQLELIDVMPPPAPRPAPPQQQQQPAEAEQPAGQQLHGWLDLEAGRGQQQPREQHRQQQQQRAQQAKREASPAPPPAPGTQQQQVQAMPVPGKPLKIRLKIPRAGSEPRTAPPAGQPAAAPPRADQQQLLQAVRQLGSNPLLSPIPACWAETLKLSPASQGAARQPPQQYTAAAPAAQQQQQPLGSPPAAVVVAPAGDKVASPFAPLSEDVFEPAGGDKERRRRQQGAAAPQRAPSPPSGAQGTKRPAEEAALPAARAASLPGAAAQAPRAAGGSPQLKRRRSDAAAAVAAKPGADGASAQGLWATHKQGESGLPPAPIVAAGGGGSRAGSPASPAAPGSSTQGPSTARASEAHQQRAMSPVQAAPPSVPAGGGLAAVAALLPAVFHTAATSSATPASSTVQELQKEGKKLKSFAEKRMKDGKPTHISSMFLCQSCVKFLEVAAAMEAHPAKFSRDNTSSMYSQTASLLDACAHNAARAEGPAAITAAISLLAERLAAVARLRAAFCLRAEGAAQAAAFKAALERGSGETYQRPSPTDSNTSTSISLPLEPAGSGKQARAEGRQPGAAAPAAAAAAAKPAAAAATTGGVSYAGSVGSCAAAAALVGMPKVLLERQLMAAQHSHLVFQALASFGKSGERLRQYMGQAAAQSSVHGLKAAAASLLLSADAGMGPAGAVLGMAKEALDAVMAMQ